MNLSTDSIGLMVNAIVVIFAVIIFPNQYFAQRGAGVEVAIVEVYEYVGYSVFRRHQILKSKYE